jgi:hypothetical protein
MKKRGENNIMYDDIAGIILIIKDVCIAIGSVGALFVAYLGLRTWWRELKGKTEYDLARRIVTTAYKMRNAIQRVRNPFMSVSEYGNATKPEKSPGEFKNEDIAKEYRARWDPVYHALVQLDEAAAEAEALWGPKINEAIKPLKECSKELLLNVNQHLMRCAIPSYREAMNQEQAQKIDSVIYSVDGPGKDEFHRRLLEAVKRIEGMLKPHLLRR